MGCSKGYCLLKRQYVFNQEQHPVVAQQKTKQRGVTTFCFLLLPTPGTTYAPAQPLGAERRGGCACGC
jgi:hypothetical protein